MSKKSASSPSADEAAVLASLKGKYNDRSGSNGEVKWKWEIVDQNLMYHLTIAVSKLKGAVMFGADRQGHGGTLCVWIGGEKVVNKWYRPDAEGVRLLHEDMEGVLEQILSVIEAL